jgi:hypothetical protein
MKTFLSVLLGLLVAIFAMVAAFLVGLWLLNAPGVERNSVEAGCKQVKVGMTFSEMSAALHAASTYSHESADFGTNEYLYSGRNGTCRINMDASGTSVTAVQFAPHSEVELHDR